MTSNSGSFRLISLKGEYYLTSDEGTIDGPYYNVSTGEILTRCGLLPLEASQHFHRVIASSHPSNGLPMIDKDAILQACTAVEIFFHKLEASGVLPTYDLRQLFKVGNKQLKDMYEGFKLSFDPRKRFTLYDIKSAFIAGANWERDMGSEAAIDVQNYMFSLGLNNIVIEMEEYDKQPHQEGRGYSFKSRPAIDGAGYIKITGIA